MIRHRACLLLWDSECNLRIKSVRSRPSSLSNEGADKPVEERGKSLRIAGLSVLVLIRTEANGSYRCVVKKESHRDKLLHLLMIGCLVVGLSRQINTGSWRVYRFPRLPGQRHSVKSKAFLIQQWQSPKLCLN